MKEFAVIFVVVLMASTVYGKQEKNADDNEIQKLVTAFLEQKASSLSVMNDIIEMVDKTKKNCPDLDVKLNATIAEVQKCTEEIKIGPNTICTILKTYVIQCTQPVRELMTSCLPQESKGLPLVLERIFITMIRQACSSTMEEFLEFFNPCQFSKSVSNFSSCQELTTVVESFKNKLPSKEFICSILPIMRNCSKDIHNTTCTNIITKTVFLNLHQALEDNTKDVCRAGKNELN
ncbi:unnamed protein product [Psylliodes chrysocephalus]|uniref:Uncharacterized protein n=1 Tax=Psylliodes chrysocephalus TaxID=3402493 RepID=A0A9P0CIP7_9CUCU|nr:unnamed protein product [Psylliodes chrysocephala]